MFVWEKAMAPHSSTLAWKTPSMEEPGGLQSMGMLKNQTQLSDFTFTFHFHALKEMAAHSSVLAWRISGTGEPDGLPSVGLLRVGHDWSDLAAAAAAESETVSHCSFDSCFPNGKWWWASFHGLIAIGMSSLGFFIWIIWLVNNSLYRQDPYPIHDLYIFFLPL